MFLTLIFFAFCATATIYSSPTKTNANVPPSPYDFALLVAHQIAASGAVKNAESDLVYSTASLCLATSMAYMGSASQTQLELHRSVIKPCRAPTLIKLMQKFMGQRAIPTFRDDDQLQMSFANHLLVNDRFRIDAQFASRMEKIFKSTAEAFGPSNASQVVDRVNGLVADETKGRIRDLLPRESVDADTALVLVNALYFRGGWQLGFRTGLTHRAPFQDDRGRTRIVDMMKVEGEFEYSNNSVAQALQLPYKGGEASMIIVLPHKGNSLMRIVRSAKGRRLVSELLSSMDTYNVKVSLPKFEISKSLKFENVLQKLGVVDAFTDRADFSRLGTSPSGKLFISDVFHKAFIKINENGTEAAAATSMQLTMKSGFEPETAEFVADHPFMFFISTEQTYGSKIDDRVVLFSGQYYGSG